LSWSDVAQEVVEAYTEAQKAVGKIKPAELEQKLKSRRWRFIQSLSVVLKLDFSQPKEGKVKELATSLNLQLGSIRLFDHVLISEVGGILRISTKFPKDSPLEVLKTLLT
jgi:hypothetical protein